MSRRRDWEKANRKDLVHDQGSEPVWHDFPDRYICSSCRLELGRHQFQSLDPPICRDCS